MLLVSAKVGPYKSIDEPQTVEIEKGVTVLVGMNEAGKTVFLQSLQKSEDVFDEAEFSYIDDYPRKNLNNYERKHATNPDDVTELSYVLSDFEVAELNKSLGTKVPKGFRFSVTHKYDNKRTIGISVDEKPVLDALSKTSDISTDFKAKIQSAASLREVPTKVEGLSLTDVDKALLAKINERIKKTEWASVVSNEAWVWLSARIPKFMYFGDYEVLPSKMNLADLASRQSQAKANPGLLTSEHKGILALLRMANISIDAFSNPGVLESLISRIEAVSISLTDQIMEFWKQNEDLSVKIDIRSDPQDQPPFNNGPNLYIRIANNRHRGVTTPFKQRSRGFIWFFSFLVWFDSVQNQVDGPTSRPPILLLDEPGLSLHALAQEDFLSYIDNLAERHQVIFSTHSPFMIHSDRLHEVRVVEDRVKVGTTISSNISWAEPRTVFPLQAALGWTIAQNLFISKQNLLVEGTSDMVYLEAVGSALEVLGRTSLKGGITIVPTGGIDKIVTFIALLGANKLKIVVLHDYRGSDEQKLVDMMREKVISAKLVMNVSQFRDVNNLGKSGIASDIEDLLPIPVYLSCFNEAFAKQLKGAVISEGDLPPGDRIVDRIERYLDTNKIALRPSGGFNHHAPAAVFARTSPTLDDDAFKRFEALFSAINELF